MLWWGSSTTRDNAIYCRRCSSFVVVTARLVEKYNSTWVDESVHTERGPPSSDRQIGLGVAHGYNIMAEFRVSSDFPRARDLSMQTVTAVVVQQQLLLLLGRDFFSFLVIGNIKCCDDVVLCELGCLSCFCLTQNIPLGVVPWPP